MRGLLAASGEGHRAAAQTAGHGTTFSVTSPSADLAPPRQRADVDGAPRAAWICRRLNTYLPPGLSKVHFRIALSGI
jgi:hypothetical protein